MTSHSISAFQITVRNSTIRGRDKNSILENILTKGKSHDFIKVVEAFLVAHSTSAQTFLVNKINKIVKVEEIQINKNSRDISFYIKQGAYGTPGEIISSKSLKTTYQKKSEEADLSLYFVQIRIPKSSKTGYAILHSIGSSSVKSWLVDHLGLHVNSTLPNCVFRFSTICSRNILKTYLKDAEIQSIKISNFEPESSGDVANFLSDENIEKILTLKKEGGFGKLPSFLKKGQRRDNIIALSDEECRDVKAEVTFNGRRRTISLEGSKSPKAKFYLTDQDVDFIDGLPTRDSIAKFATTLLDDLINEISSGP